MDEKKLINIDKIKTYIFLYIFAFGTTTGFIGMLLTAELENHLKYGFTILFFLAGLLVFPICLKYEKRFNGNRLGCKVYSFNHISYEELLQKVYDYAMKNEYINKEELITNRDEKFTVYFKNNPEFLEYPKYKICVYHHSQYLGEIYKKYKGRKYINTKIKSNHTFVETNLIRFQKMVCGNWGRHYTYPRDWVDVETILIIMVDKWNQALNWVMNQSGNLPFVLVAVMVKSDPNVIYVTKDIHKNKRNDYEKKCNELLVY
ncbi:MAG: hypothetical protein IJO78_05830 [Erysipelotrichaceae bacterium]|nr:hypothetical protein [Erysipelotrichaceae bacterium]